MKIAKDWRLLITAARSAGWVLEQGKGKHPVKLRSPTGQLVVIPGTPSPGKRGLANKTAELRRAGVAV